MVRRCVLSRNPKNEKAIPRAGPQRQKTKQKWKSTFLRQFQCRNFYKGKVRKWEMFLSTWRRGNGNKRSASHPARLSLVEKKTGTLSSESCVGPKRDWTLWRREKISSPSRKTNPYLATNLPFEGRVQTA
jgi:hypothetical protein